MKPAQSIDTNREMPDRPDGAPAPVERVRVLDRAIGARISVLRRARRLSQSRCAEVLGVSFQQMRKYEQGINRISAGAVVRLAELFEVPVEEILYGGPRLQASQAPQMSQPPTVSAVVAMRDSLRDIPDPAARRALMCLISALATDRCAADRPAADRQSRRPARR
jgi:transcriptional regulator with XRE-family HTH domain